MKDTTEQAIIAASGAITKTAGTATAATGSVGFWAFMINHQQPILILCAIIGAVITIISAIINARYQKKKNEREEVEHHRRIAFMDYQLAQIESEKEKKRRQDDK